MEAEPRFMMADKEAKVVHLEKGQPEEKVKYPKSIFFIFSNEFCERFSYYGMRTILILYLQASLKYSEDTSTVIYHIFVMLCYFTPLFGGIIADSWLGKYKTIFYVSIIYAIGNILLSVGSYPGGNMPHVFLSLLGLFLIACGTGGIKPCVSSFGGDQFTLPQQQKQLESFFSIFYFSINAGSVLSCFFTPKLREIKCLGQDTCYPLAFGVPAILMILSIVFFVIGKPMYKMVKPEGKNIAIEVFKCTTHAVVRKFRHSKEEPRDHWLDYAEDKFSRKMIEDTKVLMKIIYLFTPTIIFWSLYEQQGSRWTLQASHMDGRIGSWVLQPDQMQTLNPVLVLVFIPIFESVLYPLFFKLRIMRTSLQKLSWGGFIAALAFVCSGLVQMKMQASYPVFPEAGQSQLRVYNDLNCDLKLGDWGQAPALGMYTNLTVPVKSSTFSLTTMISALDCKSGSPPPPWSGQLEFNNQKASSYLVTKDGASMSVIPLELKGYKELDKLESGNPKFKIIYSSGESLKVSLISKDESHIYSLNSSSHQTDFFIDISTAVYKVKINDIDINTDANLEPGGVYIMMITADNKNFKLFAITPPNNVSILWQIPQYFVITVAEILFSITGMEFSFTQSPASMKSVMSSIWLITDAFGNLIVVIIAGLRIFNNEAYELFLFAAMMGAVMIIFVFMAMKYTYVNLDSDGNIIVEEKEVKK